MPLDLDCTDSTSGRDRRVRAQVTECEGEPSATSQPPTYGSARQGKSASGGLQLSALRPSGRLCNKEAQGTRGKVKKQRLLGSGTNALPARMEHEQHRAGGSKLNLVHMRGDDRGAGEGEKKEQRSGSRSTA